MGENQIQYKGYPNSSIQKYNTHNFIEQYDQILGCDNFA